MINFQSAQAILLQAILEVDKQPRASTRLMQIARAQELEIDKLNYRLCRYYGQIVGQDNKSWLVKHRLNGAVVLNFDEIQPEEEIPRIGDWLLITMRHGLSEVQLVRHNMRTTDRS